MSPLLVFLLAVGAPFAALGFHNLQLSLERWDHKRHEQD